MKRRSKSIPSAFKPLAAFVLIALAFLFVWKLRDRADAQRSRVLVMTDEVFFESAIRFQTRQLEGALKERGYSLEVKIFGMEDISVADVAKISGDFANAINRRQTRLILMSPSITALFEAVGFDSFDYAITGGRPIIVGMGAILSTERFDRIWRLENEDIFEDASVFGELDGPKTMLYQSGNIASEAMRANSFLPQDDQVDISAIKADSFVRFFDNNPGLFLLSCHLPSDADLDGVDASRFVVPYGMSLVFHEMRGHHVVCPDIGKMIFSALDVHNRPESAGLDVMSASYILRPAL